MTKAADAQPAAPGRRARMSLGNVAVLLFAVAFAASGQLLLKHGMSKSAERAKAHHTSLVLTAAGEVWVWAGLVIFAISALAWMLTLSRVPLSIAYPFNALGYLGILAGSAFVLHERVNVWTLLGSALVVGGLMMVIILSPSHH
jgi:drug/metabolite transporter (DMT)-like permease